MSGVAKEGLLARWSRLKRESATENADASSAAAPDGAGARDADESAAQPATSEARLPGDKHNGDVAPELPSLEELGPDSDFRAFMDPSVDDDLRRAALKTLFRDPVFNVTDGLDVYAEDYTKLEKLTPAMVASLRFAQRNLFGEHDRASETEDAGGASDTGERPNANVATAPDRAGSDGVGPSNGDGSESRQSGIRAAMTNDDRAPSQQSTEQQKESGSTDSGAKSG
jgi:hypothetical protein